MLHAVIMAGGSGTRFWPQSRQKLPKQLLRLYGDRTMIQQTLDRCGDLVQPAQSWVVTNAVQAAATADQLPAVPRGNVLVEPAARNTAPCVGLAAIHALKADPDAILFVMPADHVIAPPEVFQQAARQAVDVVEQDPDRLVLFGIPPGFPATGYGYIERADELSGQQGVYEVASFREKPDQPTAQQYIDSGSFYWNCGIFCWKAETILRHLQEQEPETHQRLLKIGEAIGTETYEDVLQAEFPQMNSISIDYAVLERATGVTVIEAPFEWDDVGSWLAVARLSDADEHGNTADGKVVTVDASNNIIRTTDQHLVAALGVEDLIIVHTPDATMVARREDSERVKQILEQLKHRGDTQYL
ncbi:MAG: mannose-1-phosphate guanylyltransferase [Fuerstiella sp.]